MLAREVSLVALALSVARFGGVDGNPRRPINLTNSTDAGPGGPPEPIASLSSLEDAMAVLENLTTSQKQMWEQQQLREEELKLKNQAEMEREAQRTRALQEEHEILQEMKGKVSRKLRAMSKPAPYAANQQVNAVNAVPPRDCADLYLDAEETSGVYRVWPTWIDDARGFLVYCDMDTDGGGWTVIGRWERQRFPVDFYKKTWSEYRAGFGDIRNDFWLGNAKIHALSNQAAYEMRMDFEMPAKNLSLRYGRFWIDGESQKYALHLEDGPDKGDPMKEHNGAAFSAWDRNNAVEPQEARTSYSSSRKWEPPQCRIGWWFKNDCSISVSLNPLIRGHQRDMKIRPVLFSKLRENS